LWGGEKRRWSKGEQVCRLDDEDYCWGIDLAKCRGDCAEGRQERGLHHAPNAGGERNNCGGELGVQHKKKRVSVQGFLQNCWSMPLNKTHVCKAIWWCGNPSRGFAARTRPISDCLGLAFKASRQFSLSGVRLTREPSRVRAVPQLRG